MQGEDSSGVIRSDSHAGNSEQPNTVAVIGAVLTGVAGLMCVWLFIAANGLTAEAASSAAGSDTAVSEPESEPVSSASARLRILLMASAAAVLNVVGLALSIVGLFVPNRPRALALVASVASFLLLAGVFGTIAVGAFLNPA